MFLLKSQLQQKVGCKRTNTYEQLVGRVGATAVTTTATTAIGRALIKKNSMLKSTVKNIYISLGVRICMHVLICDFLFCIWALHDM